MQVLPSTSPAALVTVGIPVAVFLYGLFRYPLYAFLLWGHKRLASEVWKEQIAVHAEIVKTVRAMEADYRSLREQVDLMDDTMKALAMGAAELPQIRQTAAFALDLHRENAVTLDKIQDAMTAMTGQIGNLMGLLQRVNHL